MIYFHNILGTMAQYFLQCDALHCTACTACSANMVWATARSEPLRTNWRRPGWTMGEECIVEREGHAAGEQREPTPSPSYLLGAHSENGLFKAKKKNKKIFRNQPKESWSCQENFHSGKDTRFFRSKRVRLKENLLR